MLLRRSIGGVFVYLTCTLIVLRSYSPSVELRHASWRDLDMELLGCSYQIRSFDTMFLPGSLSSILR